MRKRKDSNGRVLKDGERQRKDGIYEYRWYDKNGKRKSISSKNLDELRTKKDELQRQLLLGISIEKTTISINDVYNKWLKLKRGLKDNTFQNYQYMYNKFVYDRFGKHKLVDLRRSDVKAFYVELADGGMTVNTIDSIHSVLHQVIEMAVDDDIIRYNPADRALTELKKTGLYRNPKRRALTQNEESIFIDFIENSPKYMRWYPVFLTFLKTGLRVGELTGLTWNDIDFVNNVIYVNRTLVYYRRLSDGHNHYMINTPKTKAGTRIVPMLPEVKEALLLEKQYQRDLGIICKSVIDGYTDFVFLNSEGNVLNYTATNKVLDKIVRDCNKEIKKNSLIDEPLLLPHISNHIFRHTFATRLNEANLNFKAIQAILGHSDIQTTMDIYTDATPELVQNAMIMFRDYFEKESQFTAPITAPKFS